MNAEFQNLNLMKSSDEVHLEEGLLSVDIYVKDGELVIVAPIAGSSKENIEVIIQGDILIIKGERFPPENVEEASYKKKECYWGPFSRSIVLPRDVDKSNIRAFYENGILMIRIPKLSGFEETKKIIIE